MYTLQFTIGIILAAGAVWLLIRQLQTNAAKSADEGRGLFAGVMQLFDNATLEKALSAGSWQLVGRYRGHTFQLQSIVDTLAVRKLPSLWLMVTLPEPQPVAATFDMMMRPAGATTFSKFDFLPHTIATPTEFPEQAVIRSDAATLTLPLATIEKHLGIFRTPGGKELLISPKGLRIVVLIAEAERARYGVFRQASFGAIKLDSATVTPILNSLLLLLDDLKADA